MHLVVFWVGLNYWSSEDQRARINDAFSELGCWETKFIKIIKMKSHSFIDKGLFLILRHIQLISLYLNSRYVSCKKRK